MAEYSQAPVSFFSIDTETSIVPKEFTPTLAKKQYVSGGYFNNDVNLVLRRDTDTLISRFGDGIIAQMLRDPEIKKCEMVIKVGVLSEGMTILPAISKPSKLPPPREGEVETPEKLLEREEREKNIKRYDLAEKYAKFATRAFQNLDASFIDVLENMLDAMLYGNKVAEQTYKEEFSKLFNKRMYTLDSIRVKSRRKVNFVIDKYNKLLGFEVEVYNSKTKTRDKIIVPRKKFVVLTFNGKDSDPRGSSMLESVYNAWYLKMQLWPEYLRWLLQCAIPSLVGIAAPESEGRSYLTDSNGDIVKDSSGNPVYVSNVDGLLEALINVRNASAIALPHGAEVKPITNSVSGDPFKGMRDVLNEEIEMGLLLQTLATSEGRQMSRAASQTHMSVLDLLILYVKNKVIEMIRRDILIPLFELNFANFDRDLLPQISFGDVERRDWAEDVKAVAALFRAKYISPSQLPGFDKIIDAPVRDMESDFPFLMDGVETGETSETEETSNDDTGDSTE